MGSVPYCDNRGVEMFQTVNRTGNWRSAGGIRFWFLPCLLLFPMSALGQTEESRWGDEKETGQVDVVLTRRQNNGPYQTSAYSFRKASHDLADHRNYVDLVFNGCGSLHINPAAGMESRVADLGEHADLQVDLDPDEKTVWARQAYRPETGHVYWLEIQCAGQTMTVKYRINEIQRDEIKLTFSVVKPAEGREHPGGMAGTMGQCGGAHGSR